MKAFLVAVPSLLLLPMLSGCSLQLDAEEIVPTNACETNADCGDGAACTTTAQGNKVCAVTSSELGPVLLEVQLVGGTGASYVFPDALAYDAADAAGISREIKLALPKSVAVTGRMEDPTGNEACVDENGNVPVSATYHRRSGNAPFRFDLTAASPSLPAAADYALAVPPDVYDVYLTPLTTDPCVAPAPRLLRDVVVEGETFELDVEPGELTVLTGTVTVPEDTSLEGWILEVVDPTYGHVVSNQFELGAAPELISNISLAYTETPEPVLRLRDPEGDLSVHWVLSVLDLPDLDGHVDIDLRDLVAEPMEIEGTVIGPDLLPVPGAKMDIRSVALTGSASQNANYKLSTETGAGGNFVVNLVPGSYVVTVVPETPGLAPFIGAWEVSPGSGDTFTVPYQPRVLGFANDPLGQPVEAIPLLFSPTHATQPDYLTQVLSKPDPAKPSSWPTRSQAGNTLGDGSFDLLVDPGEVNVMVQMPAASGYPWYVLPRYLLDSPPPAAEGEGPATIDLADLDVRFPVLAQGKLVDEFDGGIEFAVIRAWIQPSDGDEPGPFIQIGETSTDESGIFVLPLPPSITLPADEPAPAP